MRLMLALALALTWLVFGPAWADEPILLAFDGISTAPGKIDEDMNRALAAELAERGIEVRFISPLISLRRPDLDVRFYASATLERTAQTRVRSRHGDSPATDTLSFARCQLHIWRFDDAGTSETLFADTLIIPLPDTSPSPSAAIPPALAERIAEVVRGLEF